jgi:hypothetical protein
MPENVTSETKRWVETWKRAAPELAAIRRRELQKIDTQAALRNLADAFESCRLHFTPPPTSGLVEQQAWFQRLNPISRSPLPSGEG